jgi:ankyrin repeat protein
MLDEPRFEDSNPVALSDILSLCHGLIVIDRKSNTVRLAHYTIERYFKRTKSAFIQEGDKLIARTCMAYSAFDIFNSGLRSSDSDLEQRLLLYPLFNYSSTYWKAHSHSLPRRKYKPTFLEAFFKIEAIIQGLLTRECKLENPTSSHKTPGGFTGLHLVALFGHQEAIRKLLEQQGPDAVDNSNRTPLSYAAEGGHESAVRLLLEKNADPYLEDAYKKTPLFYGVENGHESVVLQLLTTSAESYSKDECIRATLSHAARKGYDGMIRLLIELNSNSTTEDRSMTTLPSRATGDSQMSIIQLLTTNGASRSQLEDYVAAKLTSLASEGRELDIVNLINTAPYIPVHHDFYSWIFEGPKLDIIALVLERGYKNNFGNRNWQTILKLAIKLGHEKLTKLLLRHYPELQTLISTSGTNLVFFAIECGQTSIVDLLLGHRIIDVNMRNQEGYTMLLLAASKKDITTVNLLLSVKGVEVDSKDSTGRTLLSIMAEAGEVSVVEQLMKRSDINLNSKDNKGRTPLSWAAAKGHNDVVRILTQSGIVGVNTEDENGWTPLLWASEGAHEEVVAQLLEVKANGLKRDQHGRTALHYAAKHNNKFLTNTLLPHVKTDVFDENNKTALLIALEMGNLKVLKCLLSTVDTSLCFLVKDGQKEPLEALLDMGCDINSTDHQGRSLIYLAVVYKAILMLHFLITRNADVNKKCTDGTTPIQYAIQQQDCELVHILLKASSDISGISVKDWKSAFKEPENAVLILDSAKIAASEKPQYSISFIRSNNWSDWPIPSEAPRQRNIW